MIRREIRLSKYNWLVVLFVGYTTHDADIICRSLEAIRCKGDALTDAYEHLTKGSNDRGLTYSNVKQRVSVVAVGASEKQSGMVNTIGHELLHVVAHICEEDKIGMLGEEPCYLMGGLCEGVFKVIKS